MLAATRVGLVSLWFASMIAIFARRSINVMMALPSMLTSRENVSSARRSISADANMTLTFLSPLAATNHCLIV